MTMPLKKPLTCDLNHVSMELWVDDPQSTVATQAYFDDLLYHGIDLIAVMVDNHARAWKPLWSFKRMEKLGELCWDNAIELALTCWPWPDKQVIRELTKGMTDLIRAAGPAAVEWEDDMEANWLNNAVRGFRAREGRSPIDLAGDYWIDAKEEAIARIDEEREPELRSSMTTFTAHTENGRAADIAPYYDLLIPQAYAVRHRRFRGKNRKVPQSHTYGPGRMVEHTLDRTRIIIDSTFDERDHMIELGCGHALYDQRWPMGPEAAMALNLDIAVGEYGCRRNRCWSSKWAIGKMKHKTRYAGNFLRSVAEARGRV